MLQIAVQNDVDIIMRTFLQSGIPYDPQCLVVTAVEQDRGVLGYCIFRIHGEICRVFAINGAADDVLADGLLRAALNLALNRGAVTALITGGDKPVAISELLACRHCGCGISPPENLKPRKQTT